MKSISNIIIFIFLIFSLKINSQIQEGINTPIHPLQDTFKYDTLNSPNTSEIDLKNKLLEIQNFQPSYNKEDALSPDFGINYEGVFFVDKQAIGNVRFKNPISGTLKLYDKSDNSLISVYNINNCFEKYFRLPKLNASYEVTLKPINSNKEHLITTLNSEYTLKEGVNLSGQGYEYVSKFFAEETNISTYSNYLADYQHPFEAMSLAQQHIGDIYTLDEMNYFSDKSEGKPAIFPSSTSYSNTKLDSIYQIWKEFNDAVKYQFGKDLDKLTTEECDSLNAWIKRISMKYLTLYIYKKKNSKLSLRGDGDCSCVSIYTNIANTGIYMPEYASSNSIYYSDKLWTKYELFPNKNNITNPTSYFNTTYNKSYVSFPMQINHNILGPISVPFHGFDVINAPPVVDLDGDGDNWAQYGGSVSGGPGFKLFNEHTGSCTAPYNFRFRSGGGNQSPNSVEFKLSYICLDWLPEFPKNCACDVDLNLQYYYTSNSGTQVFSVDNCSLHTTHSFARVDQLAYVIVQDDNSGIKSVLAAGAVTDSASIRNSYTSDFYKGIGSMTGAAIAAVAAPGVGTITTLGTAIFSFLGNNGIVKRYGGGKSMLHDALIDGNRLVEIKVNKPTTISLYGAINLETNGEDGFYAYAAGSSFYSLSWYVNKKDFEKINPACCRPAFGAYYKFGGDDHTSKVNNHFHLAKYPGYNVPILNNANNYGKFESPNLCNSNYINQFLKSTSSNVSKEITKMKGHQIYWQINSEDKFKIEVYNLAGKTIGTYVLNPIKNEKVVDLFNYSNGVYIVKISNKDYNTSYKVQVNQ